MNKAISVFLILFCVVSMGQRLNAQDEGRGCEIRSYDIAVTIRPAAHYLEAKAEISLAGAAAETRDVRLFLHKDFSVSRVRS